MRTRFRPSWTVFLFVVIEGCGSPSTQDAFGPAGASPLASFEATLRDNLAGNGEGAQGLTAAGAEAGRDANGQPLLWFDEPMRTAFVLLKSPGSGTDAEARCEALPAKGYSARLPTDFELAGAASNGLLNRSLSGFFSSALSHAFALTKESDVWAAGETPGPHDPAEGVVHPLVSFNFGKELGTGLHMRDARSARPLICVVLAPVPAFEDAVLGRWIYFRDADSFSDAALFCNKNNAHVATDDELRIGLPVLSDPFANPAFGSLLAQHPSRIWRNPVQKGLNPPSISTLPLPPSTSGSPKPTVGIYARRGHGEKWTTAPADIRGRNYVLCKDNFVRLLPPPEPKTPLSQKPDIPTPATPESPKAGPENEKKSSQPEAPSSKWPPKAVVGPTSLDAPPLDPGTTN